MTDIDPTEKFCRSVWRSYPGIPEWRVKIRPLSRVKYRQIKRRAAGIRRHTGETREEVEERLIYCYIVEDWENIPHPMPEKGIMPRTDENVTIATLSYNEFADWLATESLTLMETLAAERADALKNSQASHGGSAPGPRDSKPARPAGSSGS